MSDPMLDALWNACVRYGLHRGYGHPPMQLQECSNGYRVTVDGVTHSFQTKDEVRDFQRKIWNADQSEAK